MPALKKAYKWVRVLDRQWPRVLWLEEENHRCYIVVRRRVFSIVLLCERSCRVVAPHCRHLRLRKARLIRVFPHNQVSIDAGKNQAIIQRDEHIDI